MEIPPLAGLGPRLMICGPSSNGKSTLAVAIERRTGWPAVHLDRFRHQPDTDWVQRPDTEFAALHDSAIRRESWVMEGNYSKLMPARLKRATGIVLLGANRWANLIRYIRRSLFETQRAGYLEGARDRGIKWSMVHWILVVSPGNLARYRQELPRAGLPIVEIDNIGQLNRLYAAWGLTRD
ncbi:MAG: AAA family ATPase [Hyphomicrobiales bacterium]|nr:MAG: AAA family ATPase [Hyphomicrobiales bacterium]